MYHAASRTAETLISSRIDTDTEAGIDRQRRHRHGRTWKYWLGGLQTQISTDVNTNLGAGTEADTETDIHKNADTATNISPQTQIKTQTNRYEYRHTHIQTDIITDTPPILPAARAEKRVWRRPGFSRASCTSPPDAAAAACPRQF